MGADRRVRSRPPGRGRRRARRAGRSSSRRRRSPRRPRRPGSSPVRAVSTSTPCPAAGTSASSGPPASAARPEPLQPGEGQDDRVVAALRQAAQARVDVAAQLGHSRSSRSACSWAARRTELVPTRAPAGSSSSERAPQRASRGSARGGAATSSSPSRELGGHVLGRVHGEVDVAAQERLVELLDPAALVLGGGAPRRGRPSVAIGTSSAPPSAPATAPAWASASALPRVPSLTGAGGAAGGLRRRLGRRARASVPSWRPNSSRTTCWRAWSRTPAAP